MIGIRAGLFQRLGKVRRVLWKWSFQFAKVEGRNPGFPAFNQQGYRGVLRDHSEDCWRRCSDFPFLLRRSPAGGARFRVLQAGCRISPTPFLQLQAGANNLLRRGEALAGSCGRQCAWFGKDRYLSVQERNRTAASKLSCRIVSQSRFNLDRVQMIVKWSGKVVLRLKRICAPVCAMSVQPRQRPHSAASSANTEPRLSRGV